MTADTRRGGDALSLTAPFEIVPRHAKALRNLAPPAAQILTVIPQRRLTGGLVVRASRISGPSRFA
ncbi:MAG TPA: hypothetical protein VFI49_06270 [Rudaea sp.]|nr:hypothetical protein [Rudaea sp.]